MPFEKMPIQKAFQKSDLEDLPPSPLDQLILFDP